MGTISTLVTNNTFFAMSHNVNFDTSNWVHSSTAAVAQIELQSDGDIRFRAGASKTAGETPTWVESMILKIDGGIEFPNLLQQSAAGLVVEYDTSSKEIYAETSSSRFKDDIELATWDTSGLLNLEVKSYTDKETGRRETS